MHFFYWDTYFTNLGLFEIGMYDQAENNLCNIASLIERLGFMPNADVLTDRSQPPLFVRGVYDYWRRTGDRSCIARFLPAMLREYEFWMTERMTPCGLNRYQGQADSPVLGEFSRGIRRRGWCWPLWLHRPLALTPSWASAPLAVSARWRRRA